MPAETPAEPDRWLMLLHQLPAKPAYFRVKIWRRLQALGAVTIKNSVYALPASEQAQEDFEWLLKEIGDGGGEAMICEARLLDGLSDDDVRALFNQARAQDYAAVSKDARALSALLRDEAGSVPETELRTKVLRLRAELERVAAIDFFGADGRETADGLLRGIETKLRREETVPETVQPQEAAAIGVGHLRGRVWVTRKGVHVDRIASAWLIRRFIDSDATFKFVPAKGYAPMPGELRFDMYEGEFTHEGDHCTFEVLTARAHLADPALAAIGEIVHDIDLKDAKFARVEASGIASVIESIAAANRDDERRLERGAAVLDDLYELFRRKR
ncbi:MAG: chromate resistance protein ChrB domain-containing protein [Rhodopila sp.]